MPLPLTVFCFSKIQIGFPFLVPAHQGSPGQRAVKRVCVCVCVCWYRIRSKSPHRRGVASPLRAAYGGREDRMRPPLSTQCQVHCISLLECNYPLGICAPFIHGIAYVYGFLGHASLHSERHLNQSSRSAELTLVPNRQTDRETHALTQTTEHHDVCSNSPSSPMHCAHEMGLKSADKTGQILHRPQQVELHSRPTTQRVSATLY